MSIQLVLDNGYVRLVDWMGDDLSVVRAARVSHEAAWRTGHDRNSDSRLIRYMLANKHTSPFEHVTFTFEVKAPIFVFRQWHRHRTWSFNEVSARYSELPEEFYVPDPSMIGQQHASNKQARDLSLVINEQEESLKRQEVTYYKAHCSKAFDTYRHLIEQAQWPRELARMVLPMSTYSHMFATVDLHNLLHFLELRDHSHAQLEIRVYAQAIRQLISNVVPTTLSIWDDLKKDSLS